MKKITLIIIATLFGFSSIVAKADNKVTIQLKWVTQAQFAGYYVAQDKGFYADEGLEVTILPGGPDVVPPQVMAGGAGVVTGSALGRAGGTATYDFINDLVRAAGGIEQPSQNADPGMQALAEMRNSAMFTTMAAGLGPAFSAARPVVGKILGLGQDGSAMSKLADKYGIPIGISISVIVPSASTIVKTIYSMPSIIFTT